MRRKRKKITICSRHDHGTYSRPELLGLCRDIVDRYAGQVIPENSQDLAIARWALQQRKPELNPGKAMPIGSFLYNGNYCLHYFDASRDKWEAFSYNKAMRSTTSNYKDDVYKAFRSEIHDQIKEFREREFQKPKNDWLKRLSQKDRFNVHVDHLISFSELIEEFCRIHDIYPSHLEITRNSDDDRFLAFRDREIAKKWQRFHRQRAKLQVVTKEENYRRNTDNQIQQRYYD
ncbi:hypothetical protein [Moorena sp. SIO3A5]|uniref:hypothetical protein n=1 Tax=Moorena sp. SIO3A5 TaxID=2607822 RepID=UPI00141CC50E|nr:hypothetical protein [Moorena sp. SIO3A5]NEP69024.1 hypothetical protein [Moorena sp. SIO3A5]